MDWLNQYAWIGALLFARLGSVMMIAPAWGEQTTPPMMRLGVAVLITATLAPSLAGSAPPMPADVISAIPMMITEIITGLAWFGHFEPFRQGLVHLKHSVYCGLVTFVALFAATRVLEARRWR